MPDIFHLATYCLRHILDVIEFTNNIVYIALPIGFYFAIEKIT